MSTIYRLPGVPADQYEEREPDTFPCWLSSVFKGTQWWWRCYSRSVFVWDKLHDCENGLTTHWSPDAPTPPEHGPEKLSQSSQVGDELNARKSPEPATSSTPTKEKTPETNELLQKIAFGVPLIGTPLLEMAEKARTLEKQRNAARREAEYKTLYFDLIYQVASVWPGESRHETAKRYIREREERVEGPAQEANPVASRHLNPPSPEAEKGEPR